MATKVQIDIGVRDTTAGAVSSLNKRLASINGQAARVREPFEQLGRSYGRFLKLSGADAIAGGLANVGRAGYSAFQSVARIVEPLGVIAGAATIAGMMKLATAWANFGTQLGQTAARAGLSATQLQGLQNAAQLAGVSGQAMGSAMTTLRDNMSDAIAGKAPQVVGMMQALGVQFRDAGGHARATTALLPELADKIAGLHDPTLQAQAATALFGGAGEALLPFLRRGSAGIAEYTEKARRYGLMSDEGTAAADKLREAQTSLTMAVTGLGNSISEKLSPIIGPLLTQMADWIARNRDWISTGIGDVIGRFADYIKSVDWPRIGQGIATILTAVSDVTAGFGRFVAALGEVLSPIDTVVQRFGGWYEAASRVLAVLNEVSNKIFAIGGAFLRVEGLASGLGDTIGTRLRGLFGGSDPASPTAPTTALPGIALPNTAPPGIGETAAAGEQRVSSSTTAPAAPATPRPGWFARALGISYGAPSAPAAPTGPAGPEDLHDPGDVRGMRNNNPGNLNFAGQDGAALEPNTGSGQRFAKFRTMDEGISALAGQLQRYGQQRVDTVNTILNKYAPGFENDTGGYVSSAARNTGFDPNAHLNMNDPAVLKKLMKAIVTVEVGRNRITDAQIDHGLATRLGQTSPDATTQQAAAQPTAQPSGPALALPPDAGTAAQPAGTAPDGQLQVGVRVQGPAGTRTTATQTGQGMAPLQIQRATVGAG